MEDDASTGRVSSTIYIVSIEIVSTLFDEDGQMKMQKMEVMSGIPKTIIHHILTE